MSGRWRVHAALAVAGLVAGFPAAAAVQWNREPPAIVWSSRPRTDYDGAFDDSTSIFGASHWFLQRPGGLRVTSIMAGCGISNAGASTMVSADRRPYGLDRVGARFHFCPPMWLANDAGSWETVEGVDWYPIALRRQY